MGEEVMVQVEDEVDKYQGILIRKITSNIEKFKEKTITNIVTSREMLANIEKLKEIEFKDDCHFLKSKLEKTLRLYLAARMAELKISNLILSNVQDVKSNL